MPSQPSATKYGFRIRTRNGAVVDKLSICGRDEKDAERKLRQIYLGCEILERRRLGALLPRTGPVSYEDVVDLISGPLSPGVVK
ncbi:MAG: hypothetical protein KBG62_09750 [Propionivibrio sp.]|nr:hypothetical protein [Propionivibrio sp.]